MNEPYRAGKQRFDFNRTRQWRGWGAHREWPPVNPIARNPNHYVYISERFITRIIFRS